MRFLFFLGFSLLLCFCGVEKSQENNRQSIEAVSKREPVPKIEKPFLETKWWPQSLPNQYFVRLRWSWTEDSPEMWKVLRTAPLEERVFLSNVPGKSREFVDQSPLKPGTRYQYFLCPLLEDETRCPLMSDIEIPKDLVLNEPLFVTELKNIRRLFLGAKALLYSREQNLSVKVGELIAEPGAALSTFLPGDQATAAQHGRQGGLISVEAETARGTLQIFARGEKGGTGLTGTKGSDGLKGVKGKPAVVFRERGLVADAAFSFIQNPNTSPEERARLIKAVFRCQELPGAGGDGEPGGIGGPGGQGGNGGNSGRLYVNIQNASSFVLKDFVEEGLGGDGGDGGEGGTGGEGGDPGDLDEYHVCAQAMKGKRGWTGPKGLKGLAGQAGNRLTKCLRLGTFTYGDCSQFPP